MSEWTAQGRAGAVPALRVPEACHCGVLPMSNPPPIHQRLFVPPALCQGRMAAAGAVVSCGLCSGASPKIHWTASGDLASVGRGLQAGDAAVTCRPSGCKLDSRTLLVVPFLHQKILNSIL